MSALNEIIDGALWWAEAGVPVFPCAGNKAPLTSNGFYDAVTDPDKVRALFEFYGDAAQCIGIRTGKASGIFVMDFDLYKGDQPKNYMEQLLKRGALPDSRTHRTLNGGLHVFYRSDKAWPNIKPCPGVEVKSIVNLQPPKAVSVPIVKRRKFIRPKRPESTGKRGICLLDVKLCLVIKYGGRVIFVIIVAGKLVKLVNIVHVQAYFRSSWVLQKNLQIDHATVC